MDLLKSYNLETKQKSIPSTLISSVKLEISTREKEGGGGDHQNGTQRLQFELILEFLNEVAEIKMILTYGFLSGPVWAVTYWEYGQYYRERSEVQSTGTVFELLMP